MSELIVPSLQQVRQYARGALSAADALEVTPVPIDDIIDAVGLHKEDLFTLGEENLPPRMLAIARKFSSRILGAMAIKEKVLYVDESLVTPRKRFTQAHEIGHKALP
jgi:Zn-dependent peptidase ImmA (M78 family)